MTMIFALAIRITDKEVCVYSRYYNELSQSLQIKVKYRKNIWFEVILAVLYISSCIVSIEL